MSAAPASDTARTRDGDEGIAPQRYDPTPEALAASAAVAPVAVPKPARAVGVSRGLALALLILLLVAAVALPWWMAPETARQRVDLASSAAVAPAAPPAAAPIVLEQDPAARAHAQDVLEETLARRAALPDLADAHWAKSALARVEQDIAAGEHAYREQRYGAAEDAYRAAQAGIAELADALPDALAAARDAGSLALAQGDSAAASAAFARALALAPDDPAAVSGHRRAQSLDAVRALIAQAEGYERLGHTEQALAAYREALALDAETSAAQAAIARLERDARGARFEEALSAAHAARERGDFAAARAAVERALALDPNAAEARAAASEIAHAASAAAIARALAKAEQAAHDERWNEARAAYEQALAADPDLIAARAGRDTAATRAALDARLSDFLARPERLGDAAVQAEADRELAAARRSGQRGQRLERQLAELAQALSLARTPVAVSLVSDGETRVVLLRYGDLGRFAERPLALPPGRYTAVGSRDGYRDVRVEFDLDPAQAGASVTVLCTEKIAFGN